MSLYDPRNPMYAQQATGSYVGATPAPEWGGGYAGYGSAWAGATPAQDWAGGGYAGYAAFGVLVPTPLPGQADYAPNMKPQGYSYCGSKYGFQQMLQDLGFYKGMIDGKIGTGTLSAAKKFATAHGAPWGGSLSNEYCAKLIQVWDATMNPAPKAPPASPTTTKGDVPAPPTGRPDANGNGVPATTNGNGAAGWWGQQSTGVKVAIGLAGVSVVGLLLYAVLGKKKATPNRRRYKPNKRRARRLTPAQTKAVGKIRGKRARAKTGKITTLKSGKRYGHLKPPKRYWKAGARRPSDYADPEHYKYPLVFRTQSGKVNQKKTRAHIVAAKSYFARNKRKYPPTTRRRIARNINKASKRYGVGGKVAKP